MAGRITPSGEPRRLRLWLILGVYILPILFFWFLLRPGYSHHVRLGGGLLMLFSLTMVPPIVIARIFHDGNWHAFGAGMAISVVVALAIMIGTAATLKASPPISSPIAGIGWLRGCWSVMSMLISRPSAGPTSCESIGTG